MHLDQSSIIRQSIKFIYFFKPKLGGNSNLRQIYSPLSFPMTRQAQLALKQWLAGPNMSRKLNQHNTVKSLNMKPKVNNCGRLALPSLFFASHILYILCDSMTLEEYPLFQEELY